MSTERNETDADTAGIEDALACEYEKRPRGAPSFFDLQPAIRGVHRAANALLVEFDPAQHAAVHELVAAERLCCPTIGWDLSLAPTLQLRISAPPGQLEVFEQFLTPSAGSV